MKYYCHDVLQHDHLSYWQKRAARLRKPLFDLFKDSMEAVDKEIDIIQLVVAEGIDKYPEWVQYIKDKKYKVECHGWEHRSYKHLPREEVIDHLKRAKDKIEKTFNQKVTIFHPPKNLREMETIEAAKEVGLELRRNFCNPKKFVRRWGKHSEVDFHYWVQSDVNALADVIERAKMEEPIFIVGAPRSGTTAYLRWLAGKTPNAIALKEVENHWKKGAHPINFYIHTSMNSGKRIIDKNCRNSVRLEKITQLFPDAEYIHVIRDGRASAYSWMVHNTRLDRYDQTIEQAAYQWVHFVKYILNRKGMMKNYREVRYEDLCRDEDYFVSRNHKWRENLNRSHRLVLEKIQRPLLKQLGYL